MSLRLQLFGAPALVADGAAAALPAALPFERRSQLLAYLALKRAWVGRAELAALLWPEQQTHLAYANLRKTLFRLQSVPWGNRVESDGGALRFLVDNDVAEFDAAVREGRHAAALELRRAELLAGFDDDGNAAWSGWLHFERDRLRLAWRNASLECLGALEGSDAATAGAIAARLLEADPLDEAALRAYMALLARGGHIAQARRAFGDYATRLADELGLTPGAELQGLYESLGGERRAAVLVAPDRPPSADGGFIGRTVELRRLGELLAQPDCRLVSLVGHGGVGKTRLARRALQDLGAQFRDGARFVPLDDVEQGAAIGGRLARELDVRLGGKTEPLDQVIASLRERQMLLVLDNFEQLTASADVLARLLDGCAGVKLIVTSRVRLALAAEWLLPVDGLPCPEPDDADRLDAFDAPRLFLQAAQRVEPALAAAVEAAAIAEICRLVDGMPLALELAAAWTRVLSCDAIAAELRSGTELLRVADEARPARHASIEVVFEQSWRLLGTVERDTLAALSVFRGGFSAPAARAVTGAALPVLGALSDKSLLRKDGARLGMHPLLQQLAALRLEPAARADRAREAHARYYAGLLDQQRRGVEHGERDALDAVEAEFENLRAAWHWSVDAARPATLRQLAPVLFYFSDQRGRYRDAEALLARAAAADFVGDDAQLQALLLGQVAHLVYRQDRYEEAIALADRSLAAAGAQADAPAKAQGYQVLGGCALRQGRLADAMRHFEQSQRCSEAAGDRRKAASSLHNQAVVARVLGRRDEARRRLQQLLVLQQALGDHAGQSLVLVSLGLTDEDDGDFPAAISHLEQALAIGERHGFVNARTTALMNLAGIAVKQGDDATARRYGARALEVATATGNRLVAVTVRNQFAILDARAQRFDEAGRGLREALREAVGMGQPMLVVEGLLAFAELLLALGDSACAHQVLDLASSQSDTPPALRDELRRVQAQLPPASQRLATPAMALGELVGRIVADGDADYGALRATLRAAAATARG